MPEVRPKSRWRRLLAHKAQPRHLRSADDVKLPMVDWGSFNGVVIQPRRDSRPQSGESSTGLANGEACNQLMLPSWKRLKKRINWDRFAYDLKQWREVNRVTMRDLALRLSVSHSTVCKIENTSTDNVCSEDNFWNILRMVHDRNDDAIELYLIDCGYGPGAPKADLSLNNSVHTIVTSAHDVEGAIVLIEQKALIRSTMSRVLSEAFAPRSVLSFANYWDWYRASREGIKASLIVSSEDEVAEVIQTRSPAIARQVPILLLEGTQTKLSVSKYKQAIRAGVAGIVPTNKGFDYAVAAMRIAMEGGMIMSTDAYSRMGRA